MTLDRYRRKRDFTKTPEPAGSAARPEDAETGRRFVVQRHRATRLHYDFRLEVDGVLVSWAVPKGPSMNPADRRMAVHVEDHPLDYIDFEGIIPRGQYGGGDVVVWDMGTWEPEETSDPARALRAGELKFVLSGRKLRGRFTIVRTGRDAERGDRENWLLIKKRDESADPAWNVDEHSRSVLSGRTNDEVAARAPAVWDSGVDASEATIRLEAAREAPLPEFVEPMLATLSSKPFSDPDWLFEIKWDGYRVEAVVDDGRVRLWTRNRQDAAVYFPELSRRPDWIAARQAIVDGEVVAVDGEGRPRFELLQGRLGRLAGTKPGGTKPAEGVKGGDGSGPAGSLAYQVFDLLYHDGRSLLDVPLEDRKRLLRSVLREDGVVHFAGHVVEDGRAFYDAASERGLEGVVAKLRRSRYEAGRRSTAWLKLKIRAEQEVVVAGWLPRKGSTADLGSLIAAVYEGDRLVHAGQVGSGFDGRTRTDLLARLAPLARPESPITPRPRIADARWVEPRLVARVEFAEWTRDGRLRQPVFLGLEPERDPKTVTRERPVGSDRARREAEASAPAQGAPPAGAEDVPPAAEEHRVAEPSLAVSRRRAEVGPAERRRAGTGVSVGPSEAVSAATPDELAALDAMGSEGTWPVGGRMLALTNLDKVLFPPRDGGRSLTKRDVVRYFATIAPTMLPHLAERALNLHRYPNGTGKPGFWQKNIPDTAPTWLRRWRETGVEEREANTHVVADEVATLAWLGNQAAFEVHAWTSRIDAPDRPTFALIDIDPGTKTTWEDVLVLARLYRTALEHVGVTGLPKTTGRRGLQVWVPIEPVYGYGETTAWVEKLSRAVGAAVPDLVSWEWEVARRKGLARLDYTQNASNKTLVAPYAVRPGTGAPVSAPITWDELEDPELRSDRWTIETIVARVAERGDLFAAALTLRQRLPPL